MRAVSRPVMNVNEKKQTIHRRYQNRGLQNPANRAFYLPPPPALPCTGFFAVVDDKGGGSKIVDLDEEMADDFVLIASAVSPIRLNHSIL